MADAPDFTTLVRRFHALGKHDRRAVLDSFPGEDRARFEQALAEHLRIEGEEEERRRRTDKQFHGYSPWLADLIAETLADPGATGRLAPRAVAELTAHHQALLEGDDETDRSSLLAMARQGWRTLIGDQPGGVR